MINSSIEALILQNFPHHPTGNQADAIRYLSDFLLSGEADSVFLLKGYAGTGKTSLVGALVKTLTGLRRKTVLMAPTGRAAKVFSLYAGSKAFTIHKKIYRQKAFSNEPGGFLPAENLHKDTIFIVDEASMIANQGTDSVVFGSGRLLDDLVHYVYSGENCRLLLMGDDAQLPPVMQTESPALNLAFLKGYGLRAVEAKLTQIVRQEEGSGILFNATRLRDALLKRKTSIYPKLSLSAGADVRRITGSELIEELSSAYGRDGIDETMVVVRSNKQANIYNNGIRSRILCYEEELSSGDRLMITRNNYTQPAANPEMDFLANGEVVHIIKVRNTTELYGFRFANILARFQDYEVEAELRILLDTLQAESPTLSKASSDKLFYAIMEDYADITSKAGKLKKIKTDPYYNAVQVKYAYAVTCHKAQGGQWMNIFLDVGYLTEEMMGEEFYRWLYTALTRATARLYLVNLPTPFIDPR